MRRRSKIVIAVLVLIPLLLVAAFVLFAESSPMQLEVPQYGDPGPPPSVWPG